MVCAPRPPPTPSITKADLGRAQKSLASMLTAARPDPYDRCRIETSLQSDSQSELLSQQAPYALLPMFAVYDAITVQPLVEKLRFGQLR